ncbi:transcriptional regulator, GntR family [Jannaschia faecimaris]|uniref:Transcriptional regulator, GntR family n=1 Tax=Jannaschia faecimaris TaxID=1244108 RepID=A0A1H3RNV0_9RHOB|nr:GntR family transcriptional regulator [Jannaschia faecimaris]SDZ26908.1 transcriptional regulator, GntR family [Jannaschia faecimaris]
MGLVEQIRAAILNGEHAPGAVLSQTDLAATYGVSRIPVRDALQSLAAEKLVEVLPGKGARVVRLTSKDLDEIFDLRIMLECDLLERATARADTSAHSEADYALRKSSLEAGRQGWHNGDWMFHQTLYLPAERPRQLALVEELRTSCTLYASGYAALASGTERWLSDHGAIVQAYADGRAEEACGVLRQHLMAAHRQLVALSEERQDQTKGI